MVLSLRVAVLSDWGKGGDESHQVSTREDERERTTADVSKERTMMSKPGYFRLFREECRWRPVFRLHGIRHGGGVILVQAFMWNV